MEYLLQNTKLFVILYIISIVCTILFSEIVKKTLESCKPKYPTVSEAMVKEMTDCKEKLDEQ